MSRRTKVVLGSVLFFIVLAMVMMPRYKNHILEVQQEQYIEQAMGISSDYLEDFIENNDDYLLKLIGCELQVCERMLSGWNDGKRVMIVSGVKNILLAEKEEISEVHYLEKGLDLLSNNANSEAGYGMLLSFLNANG